MGKRRKVENPLALAVLSYLSVRPMHPYELGRALRDRGDARSIKFNQGSLYMVFGQLEKAGFVIAQETTRAGQRPERTVYAITDGGRQEMRDWLRDLVAEPRHEYPHFVAALSLIAALPPEEVVGLLRERARRVDEQRHETRRLVAETLAAGVHPLFLVEEDYRLAVLGAEAAFIEDFIERITNPQTGWAPQWASSTGPERPWKTGRHRELDRRPPS